MGRNLEQHGQEPAGLRELPTGRAWLLAQYEGDEQGEANERAESAARCVTEPGVARSYEHARQQADIWEIRRSAIEFSRIPGEHAGLALWEDAGLPLESFGDYIRDYCALVERHGYHTVLFGHGWRGL